VKTRMLTGSSPTPLPSSAVTRPPERIMQPLIMENQLDVQTESSKSWEQIEAECRRLAALDGRNYTTVRVREGSRDEITYATGGKFCSSSRRSLRANRRRLAARYRYGSVRGSGRQGFGADHESRYGGHPHPGDGCEREMA